MCLLEESNPNGQQLADDVCYPDFMKSSKKCYDIYHLT